MDDSLVETLTSAGTPVEQVATDDGSELLVMPCGGRVLGLYPGGSGESLFWINPALGSPSSAREFLSGEGWRSPGGHRLWLSPEVHLFYPRFPDLSEYGVPVAIDPGSQSFARTSAGGVLTNRTRVRHYAQRCDVAIETRRELSCARCPIAKLPDGVEYAGYTVHSSLDLMDGPSAPIGLWSLIQLPAGGEFIAPVRPGTRPRVYLGEIPAGDMSVQNSLFRHSAHASGIQKIGIKADDIYGVAGYTWDSSDKRRSLVVIRFPLGHAERYIDYPPDGLYERGYALQTCNVDLPGLGRFVELEHHTPATGLSPSDRHSEETSHVWAFRGVPQAVDVIAADLLTLKPDHRPTCSEKGDAG